MFKRARVAGDFFSDNEQSSETESHGTADTYRFDNSELLYDDEEQELENEPADKSAKELSAYVTETLSAMRNKHAEDLTVLEAGYFGSEAYVLIEEKQKIQPRELEDGTSIEQSQTILHVRFADAARPSASLPPVTQSDGGLSSEELRIRLRRPLVPPPPPPYPPPPLLTAYPRVARQDQGNIPKRKDTPFPPSIGTKYTPST